MKRYNKIFTHGDKTLADKWRNFTERNLIVAGKHRDKHHISVYNKWLNPEKGVRIRMQIFNRIARADIYTKGSSSFMVPVVGSSNVIQYPSSAIEYQVYLTNKRVSPVVDLTDNYISETEYTNKVGKKRLLKVLTYLYDKGQGRSIDVILKKYLSTFPTFDPTSVFALVTPVLSTLKPPETYIAKRTRIIDEVEVEDFYIILYTAGAAQIGYQFDYGVGFWFSELDEANPTVIPNPTTYNIEQIYFDAMVAARTEYGTAWTHGIPDLGSNILEENVPVGNALLFPTSQTFELSEQDELIYMRAGKYFRVTDTSPWPTLELEEVEVYSNTFDETELGVGKPSVGAVQDCFIREESLLAFSSPQGSRTVTRVTEYGLRAVSSEQSNYVLTDDGYKLAYTTEWVEKTTYYNDSGTGVSILANGYSVDLDILASNAGIRTYTAPTGEVQSRVTQLKDSVDPYYFAVTNIDRELDIVISEPEIRYLTTLAPSEDGFAPIEETYYRDGSIIHEYTNTPPFFDNEYNLESIYEYPDLNDADTSLTSETINNLINPGGDSVSLAGAVFYSPPTEESPPADYTEFSATLTTSSTTTYSLDLSDITLDRQISYAHGVAPPTVFTSEETYNKWTGLGSSGNYDNTFHTDGTVYVNHTRNYLDYLSLLAAEGYYWDKIVMVIPTSPTAEIKVLHLVSKDGSGYDFEELIEALEATFIPNPSEEILQTRKDIYVIITAQIIVNYTVIINNGVADPSDVFKYLYLYDAHVII